VPPRGTQELFTEVVTGTKLELSSSSWRGLFNEASHDSKESRALSPLGGMSSIVLTNPANE